MKSLSDLLLFGISALKKAGVTEYELDARLLLEFCTGKGRSQIFLEGSSVISSELREYYLKLLERRQKREPVAYIIGEREFWSLPFHVTPEVLIPRPETEFLLDRVFALTDAENFTNGNILDLCCGSGVIAAILARETGKKVYALDVSAEALAVARKNIKRHALEQQVDLVQGTLLTPFLGNRNFSLIVSNPPYVSSLDVSENLEPEVSIYEPRLALDGGEKGLGIIYEIRKKLPEMLCGGGQYFMEIGADQGEAVRNFFLESFAGYPDFFHVEILQDYSGRDRVVHAKIAH